MGHKNQEEELMQSNEIERKMEIEQLTRLIRGLEEETASFGSKIRLQQVRQKTFRFFSKFFSFTKRNL